CAGGIFWSKIRDPNSDQRPFFKATITNVQAMELAARLYRLTNDLNFKIKFDAIFAWLKTTGIVAFDYTVYDGLNSNECRLVLPQYSYNSGVLLSALSIMYKATNETFYINEASSIFNAIVRDFTTANVL
ncbi:glycoside hydrolase, partial [Obelidium mucronatum]